MVNKIVGEINFWVKRIFIGKRTDFEELCYFVKPWKVNLVASATILKNNKILLVKSKNRTQYYQPGGLVERGENPEKTCARELREELDVKIKIIAPLRPIIRWNINKEFFEKERRILVVFNYLAKITKGKIRMVKSLDAGRVVKYQWFGLKDFEKEQVLSKVKKTYLEALKVSKRYQDKL